MSVLQIPTTAAKLVKLAAGSDEMPGFPGARGVRLSVAGGKWTAEVTNGQALARLTGVAGAEVPAGSVVLSAKDFVAGLKGGKREKHPVTLSPLRIGNLEPRPLEDRYPPTESLPLPEPTAAGDVAADLPGLLDGLEFITNAVEVSVLPDGWQLISRWSWRESGYATLFSKTELRTGAGDAGQPLASDWFFPADLAKLLRVAAEFGKVSLGICPGTGNNIAAVVTAGDFTGYLCRHSEAASHARRAAA